MVPRRSIRWLIIACLALASCRSFVPASPTADSAIEPTLHPATSTPAPAYVDFIHNAKYQLGFVDSLRIVQLENGIFEQGRPGGEDYVSIAVTEFTARGDLTGNGLDEYVAMITENFGGTGVFVFLVVFADVNGELVFQTSAWIDDRPQITDLSIAKGEIFLDATVHRADDPMCCPTMRTVRHYRLINTQLDYTDYVTFTPDGRARTITIEAPSDGAETFNSLHVKGSVSIAPFENNLVYRILDLGGVELAIGSLAVIASEPGAPGTFDQTILVGNILSGAVIRLEIQDVNAQDGSLFAMDSVELVVK